MIKWSSLTSPKYLGEWGLKDLRIFSKDLVDKSCWIMVHDQGLRGNLMRYKYLKRKSLQDWTRATKKVRGL